LGERDPRANATNYKGKNQIFRGKLHVNNGVFPLKTGARAVQEATTYALDVVRQSIAAQHLV
jgi:hypothetical protein